MTKIFHGKYCSCINQHFHYPGNHRLVCFKDKANDPASFLLWFFASVILEGLDFQRAIIMKGLQRGFAKRSPSLWTRSDNEEEENANSFHHHHPEKTSKTIFLFSFSLLHSCSCSCCCEQKILFVKTHLHRRHVVVTQYHLDFVFPACFILFFLFCSCCWLL